MKPPILRVLAMAAVLSALSPAGLGALEIDPTNPCFEAFDALNQAIDQTFEGAYAKDRDRVRMLLKLKNADEKVAQLKIADAIQKIDDIMFKVEGLLADSKQKIDPEVAQDILDAADAAIGCLQSLF